MPKIGPYFYIQGRLIYDAIDLSEGRPQSGKLDNSLGHDQLFDRHYRAGDYINYPRGRVVWDTKTESAIVYIDRCINKPEVIFLIKEKFELSKFRVDFDDHYRCRKCIGDLDLF